MQFHAQRREQLARAEFGRTPALETRQGFLRDARPLGDVTLLQAQGLTPDGDRYAELLECFHLIYKSKYNVNMYFLT